MKLITDEKVLRQELNKEPIITFDRGLLEVVVGSQRSWALPDDWPGVPAIERNGVTYWLLPKNNTTGKKIRAWTEEHKRSGVTKKLPAVSKALTVPDAGMIGLGRDFADLYASHMEAPRGYFYFAWLTFLGFLVAKKVRLDSSLDTEPRLYTVLLGETASSRKSTVIEKTTKFFEKFMRQTMSDDFTVKASSYQVLTGVGSAEGLARQLETTPNILLTYDELRALLSKSRAESSVLLETISTLFERGVVAQVTSTKSIKISNASVSILGASTKDTYEKLFNTTALSLGILNRLWIVLDGVTSSFPVPGVVPDGRLSKLQAKTDAVLNRTHEGMTVKINPAALKLYEAWYFDRHKRDSLFEKRLDTYAVRLMVLLALSNGVGEVDTRIMRAVLELVQYELDVRLVTDPIDAVTLYAQMEEKIRRTLMMGPLSRRDLYRRTNASRSGTYIFDTSLKNLRGTGEISKHGEIFHGEPEEDR